MRLLYAIGVLLVLGVCAFSLQAVTAGVRKDPAAGRWRMLAAACAVILVAGLLIILFL